MRSIFNNIFNEEYAQFGSIGGFPLERAYYPSPEFNLLAGATLELGGV